MLQNWRQEIVEGGIRIRFGERHWSRERNQVREWRGRKVATATNNTATVVTRQNNDMGGHATVTSADRVHCIRTGVVSVTAKLAHRPAGDAKAAYWDSQPATEIGARAHFIP